MFFIFGWGTQTKKILDEINFNVCNHCHKENFKLTKVTSWATLFFIPIIPYEQKYYILCPNCDFGYEIDEDKAEKMIEATDKETDKLKNNERGV